MQKCIDYLPRKSFNSYGVVVLTLFGLFAVVVISISASFTFDASFHCYDKAISKTKDASLVKNINIKCSLEYQEKFLFILPMYAMFILNFGVVFAFSIIYANLVKHRVEKFDYPTRLMTTSNNDSNENGEMLLSPNPRQNPRDVRECLGRFSTFSIYVVHLLVARIIPLLVFAIWIFYQAHFPKKFFCPLGSEVPGLRTSEFNVTLNSRSNLTFIDCTNPIGVKSKTLVYITGTVDICLVALSLFELGYIAWLAFSDTEFMTDQEFCTVYLLRKRKRIRKLVNKVRDRFDPDDEELFIFKDDFGDAQISMRPLEDIYVNVVIQEGRQLAEAYPSEFKRHEIYQSHLETPSTVTKLTSPSDIFKPKKDDQDQKYPRTILAIGRPGIGKTILTRKLLHQWKRKEDEFWYEKIVILLQFRTFNNKTVSLREMLRDGDGLSCDDFETEYNFVLCNPTKTVLIFDGLDELTVDSHLLKTKTKRGSGLHERMHVFEFFKMLIKSTLLPGITVLTTSRPTAEHLFQDFHFEQKVEILGFFKEQIEEYVFKFCENNSDTGKLVWDQIEGSAELLSLCYIPVNSYIVCLTLKESIENGGSKEIPNTVTELYKRALKVLLYRHHPKYKLQPRPNDYLIIPFPKLLENDLMALKQVAKSEIMRGRLIFERTTDDEFGNLSTCGLFHKLPVRQRNFFCFLHLTLQEFLAASQVVDNMDSSSRFLETHVDDPTWHLVIQFVAGLVGDKIREAKMADMGKANDVEERRSNENVIGDDQKDSKCPNVVADIQKRLEEWAFLLGTGDHDIALLGIKCLYELQDIDIMKSVSSRFLAEGDGKLLLERLSITAVDCTALFTFFGHSENLKHLAFKQCTIQDNCNYHFQALLSTAGNTITSFKWILGRLADVAVEYLSEALKSKTCKLTELVLGGNEITDKGAEYLREALKSENCKLAKLYLGRNEITDQGVEYLSEALKGKNCKLTTLYLGDNEITDQGIEYLSEALESKNCKLTQLFLGPNAITDRGVEYLSEALKSKNCKLIKLYLDDNEITNKCLEYLSEALKNKNCKLAELNLCGNKITDQGIEYLQSSFKHKLKIASSKIVRLSFGDS